MSDLLALRGLDRRHDVDKTTRMSAGSAHSRVADYD